MWRAESKPRKVEYLFDRKGVMHVIAVFYACVKTKCIFLELSNILMLSKCPRESLLLG